VANEPRFCAVPPARIVPMLADEGAYLASESTFARVLRGPRANSAPRPSQGTQSQTPADHPHRHDRTLGLVLGHDLLAGDGNWPLTSCIGTTSNTAIVIFAMCHRLSAIPVKTMPFWLPDMCYYEAKERHPARWARHTRNWNPIGPVTLNQERDSVIAEHVAKKLIQSLAA
jgi:hypothetical protein